MTPHSTAHSTPHSTISDLLMKTAVRPAAVMARGSGSYLWDEAGNRYLDFIQGWAVNALGHSPAVLREALTQHSALLLTPSPAFHNRPQLELARRLVELTGAHQVTFLNSGAEANEAAIKLARKWGRLHKQGAFGVVTTHGAFHGRTIATMAASGKPGWDQLFPPYPPGFAKVPFGDAAAMEAAIDSTIVALMVEPIQGEAGVVVPPPGYLAALRRLCDAHDLLLIADEVQTGVGRTGRFLAQEHEQVRADITTLGKGLGGGVPVAAVLANERAACFEPGDQGSTFGGNPLMTGAALAIVEAVSAPAFLAQVREQGDYLGNVLDELASAFGGAVARGQGLLRAIVFDRPQAPALTDAARARGLLVNAARPEILRLMPQLAVSRAEIDEMATLLRQAYASLTQA
ncbi:MAG TPA: aminotransferase class III-fold pyridoxal phosphate-dependent enzyme [Polyangiaceae bacterium]